MLIEAVRFLQTFTASHVVKLLYMNRIDRVAAILIQLQSKRIVKAQEIAERFAVSLRTVYRDIKTLEEAGVPIAGEAGVGYSIMEGYRLPPVMFTKEEALAFLTADKIMAQYTDAGSAAQFQSAMYKVKAVLRYAEKNLLDNLEHTIEVLSNSTLPSTAQSSYQLQPLLNAIASNEVVQIAYRSPTKPAGTRQVEPIGIFLRGNYWYLIAYCCLRKDYRTFRTDRISAVAPTGATYHQQHPSLQSFLQRMHQQQEMYTIVINVDKDVLQHFGDQKYYNGFVAEREAEGFMQMTFVTASLKGFAKYFLLFGAHADIVSPPELKQVVNEELTSINQRLSLKNPERKNIKKTAPLLT